MDTLQISPRVVLRPGDRFRVGAGPVFEGENVALRGLFEFRSAYRKGRRVFINAVKIENGQRGGAYAMQVAGPSRPHPDVPGWRCRPYTVRRVRSKTRSRSKS